MRTPVSPCARDPEVAGVAQALFRPAPGQCALEALGYAVPRHVRARDSGLSAHRSPNNLAAVLVAAGDLVLVQALVEVEALEDELDRRCLKGLGGLGAEPL